MANQTRTTSSLLHFLKNPLTFLLLLSTFLLLLTYLSLTSNPFNFSLYKPSNTIIPTTNPNDDAKANLIRFPSNPPSQISKDTRGWLLNPVSLAKQHNLSGGAHICASLHLGQIKPGGFRGNHRHYGCNETFVIWGAETVFRVENENVEGGFVEVRIGSDEVAVAASGMGKGHALVNVDRARRTVYFVGCQDSVVDYNSSSTDFNVWEDLKRH